MFYKDFTRRDILKVGITLVAVAAAVLTSPGEKMIQIMSKPGSNNVYTTGLDFAAYNQYYTVRGKIYETVDNWSSNTVVSDFKKWTNQRFSSALTYMPYIGEHSRKNSADTLEKVLSSTKAFIKDLSEAFEKDKPMKDLIIKINLNKDEYERTLLRDAKDKDEYIDDGLGYLLKIGIKDTTRLYNKQDIEKRNLKIEIGTYPEISLEEYANRFDEALTARSELNDSKIPIIASIDDSLFYDKKEDKFNDDFLKLFSKADIAMITLNPDDWNSKELTYSKLEDKIKFARKSALDKKLFVRLVIADYFPAVKLEEANLKYLSFKELKRALEIVNKYADGSFLDDSTGLLLYRGLFSEKENPPLDHWELKEITEQMYKKFRGFKVTVE